MRRNAQFCRAMIAAMFVCSSTLASAQESAKLGPQAAEIEREGITRGDLARRTLYSFAACVVYRHRNQALQWLSLPQNDPSLSKKAYNFADDRCLMNGDMQFSLNLFRGALYAALYRTQFGEKALLPSATSAAVAAGNAGPLVHMYDMLTEFANCVVRREPSDVRDLVVAIPGTTRENQALAALSPQFPLCVVKDSRLQLTKSVVSALLAEALYEQSASLAPVSAGASH